MALMQTERVIQGRCIADGDLELIRSLLGEHRQWNRTRLSRELCERWGWRNDKGRLKDMACRTLLLKLERKGLIRLPRRQRPNPNAHRNRLICEAPHDRSPIRCDLSAVLPLRIEPLAQEDSRLALFRFLLHRYHYLGHQNCVGENLKYLVSDSAGRTLACLLFGSAAWKAGDRDEFIGWSVIQRERNLGLLTNNTRFLIMPWAKVRHLASHLLGRVCRLLPGHWMEKYAHPIHLLETFVERQRFRGTCYRAAGWTHVGATVGRSRNDVHAQLSVPVKDIYLYPLGADFRRRLCA
jgi:hypothetical protein